MKRYERSERMQTRLRASLAGLEELTLLRDRQFSQVSEAKSMMDTSRRRRSVDAGFMATLGHYPEFQTNSVPCLTQPDVEDAHDTGTDVAAKVQEWLRGSHSAQVNHGAPPGAPEKTTTRTAPSLDCVDGSVSPRILSPNFAQARRHSVSTPYHQASSPIDRRHLSVDAGPFGGLLPSKFNVQTLSRKSGSSSSTEPIDETTASLAESERTESPHERGDSPLENELSQVTGYSHMSPYRRFSVDAGDLRPSPSPSPALTSLQRRHSLATPSPLCSQLNRASVSTGALNDTKNFTLPYKLQGCRTVFNFPSPMHAVLLNSKQAVQDETESETIENLNRSSEDVQEQLCEILRKPVMEVPPTPTQTGSRRGSRDYMWLRQISEESDDVTAQSDVTKTLSVASDVTSNDSTTSTVHDDVRRHNDNSSSDDFIDVTSITSPKYDVDNQTSLIRTSTPLEHRQIERQTSPPSEQKLKRFSIRSDTDSGFAGSCMSLSTNSSHSSYSRRYHPSAWSFSSTDSDAFAADFSQGSRFSCVSSAHESYFQEEFSDDERSRKLSSIETIPEITENARDVDGNHGNRQEPSSDASPPPIPPPRRRLADNSRNRRAQSAYELKSTVQIKPAANSQNKNSFHDHHSDYEEPPVPPPRRKLQSQRRSEVYGGARPKSYKQNDYSSGTIV